MCADDQCEFGTAENEHTLDGEPRADHFGYFAFQVTGRPPFYLDV